MKTCRPLLPWKALAGASVLASLAQTGHAVTIFFDSAADLTGNFVERGNISPPTVYQWTNATGVGTPPGAVISSNTGSSFNEQNLFYAVEAFNPVQGGDLLETSVYFQAMASTSTATVRNFAGFGASTSTNLATAESKLGVRVFRSGTTDFVFQLQNGTATQNLGASFNLTDGNWYKMTFQVSRTGATTFSLFGELQDYGADGLTLNPAFSRSGMWLDVTNTNMGTSWRSGLLNQVNNGGASAFDNFAVVTVPEPVPALPMLAAGMALLLHRCRRKTFPHGC